MLKIPNRIFEFTTDEDLLNERNRYGKESKIESYNLTDKMLLAVREAAKIAGEKKIALTVDSMIVARSGAVGHDERVPNLVAFPDVLIAYLVANRKDGWLYRRGADGHLHPWLVTGVNFEAAKDSNDRDSVHVRMRANGGTGGRGSQVLGVKEYTQTFYGADVSRKKISAVLGGAGLLLETDDLKADYVSNIEDYTEILTTGFSEQYRFTGMPSAGDDYWRRENPRTHVKVIHDVHPDEISSPTEFDESVIWGGKTQTKRQTDGDPDDGAGPVPIHSMLRTFDLSTHRYLWVNTRDLTRYVYDKTLREKIILPEDQRNLLDILTTNLDEFTGDIIEGKSAGNVVMCKGEPGVGKTLTAEVYSELIERPLYSIHSGSLGITADSVRKNLEQVFERSQRWKAVLLLDEADVFVLERGMNLTQNAIVAEFLRTLEYFTGLMFMTTNRANNIDDAILSRAAAIIDYKVPDKAGIREVWKVQAANQGVEIPDALLGEIVGGFVHIAPRDVKMLLRLSLRVAKGGGHDLDIETIAKCAMFRGLHFSLGSRTS